MPVLWGSAAVGMEYIGPAVHIRDGDTFVMRVDDRLVPVRLCGVDSPEAGEHGYHQAKEALARMLSGQTVHRPWGK